MNAPPAPFPAPPGPPADGEQQLQLLTVLYFVYGAFAAMCGLMIGLLAVMSLVVGPIPDDGAALIARLMGLLMLLFSLFLLGQAMLMVVAGTYLRRRKGYVLCMVAAAVACTNIPLGAALGVFAFIVLNRPAVKQRFPQA